MSKAVLLLALLSAPLVSGCADACLTLADQICACQPDQNSQAVCHAQAQAQEQTFAVGKADEAFCQQKLNQSACNCNYDNTAQKASCCNRLNTPEGRQACGIVITSP